MKIFTNFILKLCALVCLCLSIIVILSTIDIVSLNKLADIVITNFSSNNLIVIVVSGIVAILTVIAIFIRVEDKDEISAGIAIKRETGNVYISKDTFESIVLNVTKSFASLKNFKASVSIEETGIIANIYTYILPDTVVPTLTSKLQEDIKDAILKQTTIELKEVNVKIKGVYTQAEKAANTAQN